MDYFNVRMHVLKDGRYISGAEQIVNSFNVLLSLLNLCNRAYSKISNNSKHEINFKIIKLQKEPLILKALETKYIDTKDSNDAIFNIKKIFIEAGILNIDKILDVFIHAKHMRGAIILDIHTLKLLLPNIDRGIRVSCIDYLNRNSSIKNYFKEAVSISTKAAYASGIVGEICVSDDDYPDGCITTPDKKCYGIRNFKSPLMSGGRLYLFDSEKCKNINDMIVYMESEPVIVDFSEIENVANLLTLKK